LSGLSGGLCPDGQGEQGNDQDKSHEFLV
jgi:hypothetical protein